MPGAAFGGFCPVLHLHPGWILELRGEALLPMSVGWCPREVAPLLLITANINCECSRLKSPPLACSGSVDHSNLMSTLKIVFMCCCQGLVLVLCKEGNVSSVQAAHGATNHPKTAPAEL